MGDYASRNYFILLEIFIYVSNRRSFVYMPHHVLSGHLVVDALVGYPGLVGIHVDKVVLS